MIELLEVKAADASPTSLDRSVPPFGHLTLV
jgi:hypothetical protein